MIITDVKKKLEQVDNIMNKKGFHLLPIDNADNLDKIAERFVAADWYQLDWCNLTYVKEYETHTCFVSLGRTDELHPLNARAKIPFMVSHITIKSAYLLCQYRFELISKLPTNMKDDISKVGLRILDAKEDVDILKKQLERVCSHYDY